MLFSRLLPSLWNNQEGDFYLLISYLHIGLAERLVCACEALGERGVLEIEHIGKEAPIGEVDGVEGEGERDASLYTSETETGRIGNGEPWQARSSSNSLE